MKKLLMVFAVALTLAMPVNSIAQTGPVFQPINATNPVAFYLPETNQWTGAWDHRRDDPTSYYELWLATNAPPATNWIWTKLQTISTNDFTVLGITNQLSTCKARLSGLPRGTNALAMVAVSPLLNLSVASTNFWVGTLPFPSPPQGILKL